jgi:hypothetical protein
MRGARGMGTGKATDPPRRARCVCYPEFQTCVSFDVARKSISVCMQTDLD